MQLIKMIEWAIKNNYNNFISGMALGIDMLCAKIIISLKSKYSNIMLECAIRAKIKLEIGKQKMSLNTIKY